MVSAISGAALYKAVPDKEIGRPFHGLLFLTPS